MKKTNKLISILLVIAMLLSMAPLSLTASAADAPPTVEIADKTYYQLDSADDIDWFAAEVNSGNNTINAMLTGDIVYNSGTMSASTTGARVWVPIGTRDNRFKGTFNGNGYTVSGLFSKDDEDNSRLGLVSYASGAIIVNVAVTNFYFESSHDLIAGIVAQATGTYIANCYVQGSVYAKDAGAAAAGICTNTHGTDVVEIRNCLSDVSLKVDDPSDFTVSGLDLKNYIGGIICTSSNTNPVLIMNTIYITDRYDGPIRNETSSESNYEIYDSEGKPASALATGEIAYILGKDWGQKLGTDPIPLIFSEDRVYYGYVSCELNAQKVYTNSATNPNYPDHYDSADDNDVNCDFCGELLHTHSFTYFASGDTITAVCENTDGNCPDSEGTLTIFAPTDIYADGTTAKEATVENNLVDTSVAVGDITYSTADGNAPKTAGTYTASVTVGGATASVQFELVKRSAIAENFVYTAPENLVYDGTAKYATVEASPEITGMGQITVSYYQNGEAVEPINAGTYTVKVSTADSDKYYAINDVELASFTISTKDISDAFIILGDALTYNGTEQTQTVEKVVATGTAPEVTYTVSGNKATNVGVYLLTVTGTGNFSGEAKIAYEIAVDASGIDGLTIDNVKSSDKENVEYVYNQLEKAVKDLADEDKILEWNTLQSYCAAMLQRIYTVENQIKTFENKLGEYDIDTVTSDDNDDLVNLFDSVFAFTVEYNDNLTDAEKDKCTEISADIADLTRRIGAVGEEITRITNAVNGYDKATVKSSDKADLEQLLADINALTTGNNITDTERADLLALADTVNELLAVISDTADEISRIVNAVNAYDIDTVTGDDVPDLLGLIDDANALLETDNLTAEETEALSQAVKDVQSLISRCDRTSAQLADIKERMNSYDEATVKSSDKADLEQLIADIKELTDGQNITAEEREYLVNADAECGKLLAKIAETKSEYNRVIALANGYDEATVTSADKDALVQLNDDIYALALTDNVTAEEKSNLQTAHDKVLGLIDKLTDISDEIKRIIEAVDKYVFESVKSSDKADIQQLIADIKALLDTQNLTADERTLLEGADETCDKLIAKIDETVAEVNRINDVTNAYDIDTVTSADRADIEQLFDDIRVLTDGDNLTDTERKQLSGNEATLSALLDKIAATADEIARIENAVNSYDEATVKSTDKADLEQLVEDIKVLTDATNITEDERTKLGELDATVDSLIKKIDDTKAEIDRINEAVSGYDAETVTSADVPELGKLIDDIKALTDGDNITEDEKTALEETDKAIDELVEKLAEVAEEIKRVDETVKSYDENTVKSTDKEELAQLKEDIQALVDSDNTTENEKTALGEMIEKVNALEDKIEEIENQLEEIAGIENGYDPETVTSDDKAAIEDAIAEIEAVNPDNLTDEQKAEYAEIKADLENLLDEIEAAQNAVAEIGVELEMFDEKRVTIFWEDEIEALKAKIDELLADENMGEAEIAKLNEYKAQADKLIEIINTPKEYFSLRFFYFIWDCLTWKYNGILWIFSNLFRC